LQKLQRQYTDRKKIVETPVFTPYVFVKLEDYSGYINVLKLDGVVYFIKYDNKPAGISEEEMRGLKEFIATYNQIEVSGILSPSIGGKVSYPSLLGEGARRADEVGRPGGLKPGKIVTISKGMFRKALYNTAQIAKWYWN